MLSFLPCDNALEPLGKIKTCLVTSDRDVLQEDSLGAELLTDDEDDDL
jgi:hypothetical protein